MKKPCESCFIDIKQKLDHSCSHCRKWLRWKNELKREQLVKENALRN